MELSEQQLEQLTHAARHHQTPHVRVKALAILDAARGRPVSHVAGSFLASRQSVHSWLTRYQEQGVCGLEVRAGRGRKPKADPEEIARYVLQAPENFGIRQTRWTLRALAAVVPSLRGFTPSGVKRALARAGFSYKRGQPVLHSPDPEYAEKKSRSTKRS